MIFVPENWPLAWWAADNSQVKMSCPSCGAFSLLMTRTVPSGAIASLACSDCGLAGVEPVQRAFEAWVATQAQAAARDTADLALARQEGDRGVAVERQRNTKKAA